ncbi:pyrimidine/purine nucleoside phosphorylase [Escherichia sp. HC-CC]
MLQGHGTFQCYAKIRMRIVMVKGEYTFSTAEPEEMTVISGALNVLLPDATDWQVYEAGSVFNVPGHSEFHLQVAEPTSYLCRYL